MLISHLNVKTRLQETSVTNVLPLLSKHTHNKISFGAVQNHHFGYKFNINTLSTNRLGHINVRSREKYTHNLFVTSAYQLE